MSKSINNTYIRALEGRYFVDMKCVGHVGASNLSLPNSL